METYSVIATVASSVFPSPIRLWRPQKSSSAIVLSAPRMAISWYILSEKTLYSVLVRTLSLSIDLGIRQNHTNFVPIVVLLF